MLPPTTSLGGSIRTADYLDHIGAVTTWTRTLLEQVTQVQSPTVASTSTYDPAQRLTSVTDSRGPKTLTYTYSPRTSVEYCPLRW
jgi:YD repeat-containing protein